MRFIGSKNKSPLSWLIRKATGSYSSHFAVVFDDAWVIHSNLYGVNTVWYRTFLKHNDVVWNIELDLPLEKEEEIYRSLLDENDERGYDFPALAFWAWSLLRRMLFNAPIPARNEWGKPHLLICTAIYQRLPQWLVGDVDEGEIEMTTPDKLGVIIKERLPKIQEELCR